jgi:hypothetical protein
MRTLWPINCKVRPNTTNRRNYTYPAPKPINIQELTQRSSETLPRRRLMEIAIRPRLDIVLFMTPERLTRFRNLHSSVGISRTGRNSRSGSRLQVPSVPLSTPSKLQLEVPNITFRPRRNIRLYKISRGYVHLQDLYLLFEIVRRKRNSRGGRKCFSLRRPAWPPDHIPKTKTIVSSGFNNRNATAIRTMDSFLAKLTTVASAVIGFTTLFFLRSR